MFELLSTERKQLVFLSKNELSPRDMGLQARVPQNPSLFPWKVPSILPLEIARISPSA